jgi:hypothetical protein
LPFSVKVIRVFVSNLFRNVIAKKKRKRERRAYEKEAKTREKKNEKSKVIKIIRCGGRMEKCVTRGS